MHCLAQDTKSSWCLQWQPAVTILPISLVPLSIPIQIILPHSNQSNVLKLYIQSCILLLLQSLQRFLIVLGVKHSNPEPVLQGYTVYDLAPATFLIPSDIVFPLAYP